MTRPSDAHSASSAAHRPSPADLISPATQIVADRDAYLGQARNDVGRRIADDQVELFVSADAAASLQREFEQSQPDFIALHDVGTSASLRLLTSMAGTSGARVQRLMIRRQGHGLALAVLQFVEVPLADGAVVRVYSTDVNSDATTRQALSRMLLGWSRLGVLLVGELAPHALGAALQPLRESIARGSWPNRELLLVPLGSGASLAAQGQQLAAGSAVQVHVTPQAAKPKQIWTFIGGTWNRLLGQPGGERRLETDIARAVPKPPVPWSEANTQPMNLEPLPPRPQAAAHPPSAHSAPAMPQAPAAVTPRPPSAAVTPPTPMPAATRPMPLPGGTSWQAYVERCASVRGAVACCVFDSHTMQPLASAGGPPHPDRLAQQGAALLSAIGDSTRALGFGATRSEAAISTPTHHLLLRPVPGHPGVALHVVLQAEGANLTLARMQLERIDAPN